MIQYIFSNRKKKKLFYIVLLLISILFSCDSKFQLETVEQWGIFELKFEGPSDGNPYMENDLSAVFFLKGKQIVVPGFYDGDGIYRIRFSPNDQGMWGYRTESNVTQFSNRKGKFRCVPPTGKNHGPVKIANTYYLQYADGTPFYSVGTTAYQWTSVKQSIQEKTLQTLANSPFNKIRMCVFPKSFDFGNKSEPWMHPFMNKGCNKDYTCPKYEFFQNFDKRVKQLMELNIEADVILFHPYDTWGYCEMGNEMNAKYVKYMVARLSAYRNVWWSLANEWSEPSIKESIDWEGIGTLLQNEDPHQRLRGIHNWYTKEEYFYDHSQSWITHTSIQTTQFYNAIKWRKQYKKPLLFDEMRYEGNVPFSWGNLSSQEMVSYFWMAGLSGAYATHGESTKNNADDSTEVRWWAKGGFLVGESTKRLAFFKSIMEEAPIHEMTPEFKYNGDLTNLKSNIYLFTKKGEYYLAYAAKEDYTIEFNLPNHAVFIMEIIDTWNMSITRSEEEYSGKCIIEPPSIPYTAIRLIRQ